MIKIYRFFKLSWCYFIAVLYYIPQASFCHKTSHIMVYVMYYIIAYLTTILWMLLEWLISWNHPFPPPPPWSITEVLCESHVSVCVEPLPNHAWFSFDKHFVNIFIPYLYNLRTTLPHCVLCSNGLCLHTGYWLLLLINRRQSWNWSFSTTVLRIHRNHTWTQVCKAFQLSDRITWGCFWS